MFTDVLRDKLKHFHLNFERIVLILSVIGFIMLNVLYIQEKTENYRLENDILVKQEVIHMFREKNNKIVVENDKYKNIVDDYCSICLCKYE